MVGSGLQHALSLSLAHTHTHTNCIYIYTHTPQDLAGVLQPGPLRFVTGSDGFGFVRSLSLPALPFTILMPALSLLLVFRTNTGYARWNEARTLWGGVINSCRNVVRQSNTYFPDDAKHLQLKRRMAAETAAFVKVSKY